MKIDKPNWYSAALCPICEQGQSLAFHKCPNCGILVLICDEEGSVFNNPREIAAPPQSSRFSGEACPGCGAIHIASFEPATADDIVLAGYKAGEYV